MVRDAGLNQVAYAGVRSVDTSFRAACADGVEVAVADPGGLA
jgi:hypothetical protein